MSCDIHIYLVLLRTVKIINGYFPEEFEENKRFNYKGCAHKLLLVNKDR